jgi:hypothetical protein
MSQIAHRARLVRQIRRAFTLGVPGIVLGLAGAGGAAWLGLDYTGIALLATGVLLTGMGLFLVGVGLYCSALLVEGWLRGRLTRRPRASKNSNVAGTESTAGSPPPPVAPPPGPDSFRIF